jgi:DNA-directed RNA polymerase subunit F
MVIKEEKPLTMAEVSGLVGDNERGTEIKQFIKQFTTMKPEKAKELRKKLEELEILKLKEEHIVKIIDTMPGDTTELNKIISDTTLDTEETQKILDVITKQ